MATKITRKGALIDQLVVVKEQLAILKSQEKGIIEQLNKIEGSFEGLYYKITVYHVAPMLLDKDKVKEMLGDERYNQCLKPGEEHNSVRCSRK